MSEERAKKRRKARKEPELVELSRIALEPQTALIIRLPAGFGGDKWLADLRAQLPDGASAWVVDAPSRIEIVQRGRKQEIVSLRTLFRCGVWLLILALIVLVAAVTVISVGVSLWQ